MCPYLLSLKVGSLRYPASARYDPQVQEAFDAKAAELLQVERAVRGRRALDAVSPLSPADLR
eukprot:COSAG06_NODE_983_length_11201_cov_8.679697_10_plen_62_part_00